MSTGAGTGNVFDPSNAGYPLLVVYISQVEEGSKNMFVP
jgi:hypothetical protein